MPKTIPAERTLQRDGAIRKRKRPGKASTIRFKRRRNATESLQNEIKNSTHQLTRLQHRLLSTGQTVNIESFNLKKDVNVTSTGWEGRPIPVQSRADIVSRWKDGRIKRDIAGFLPLPYLGQGYVLDFHPFYYLTGKFAEQVQS